MEEEKELKRVIKRKKKGVWTWICSSAWISVRGRICTSIHNQAHEWEYIGILSGLNYNPSSKNDDVSDNVR